MDAQVVTTEAPPLALAKKGPRTLYRAQVRNEWKAARRLPEWRAQCAALANQRADIAARAVVANGAREAAAKALVKAEASTVGGLPRFVTTTTAMLEYYRGVKHTRPVNRIIRDLERQVRGA